MDALSLDLGRIARPLLVTIIALIGVIALTTMLQVPGLAILWTFIWLSVIGVAAIGAFLVVRRQRQVAGIGAIVAAAAIVLAFLWRTPPAGIVWTLALLTGALLVVKGTALDTTTPRAWPVTLVRVVVGWAFVDNAVNDMVWVSGGTNGFLGAAANAVKREPQFLDGGYQPFVQGLVLPRPDAFAGLFLSGELVFGLLLVLGLFSGFAALGAMWLSANIILEKSFMSHGAYVDKTYFVAELFCLVSGAGLVFGLDAALHRHLPGWLGPWVTAVPAAAERQKPIVGRSLVT